MEMRSLGVELKIPDSRGWFSNHCAMEDFQIGETIFPNFPIKPIFLINFNTDNTVSKKSELLACLPKV